MNRRNFLQTLAAGATAATLPGIHALRAQTSQPAVPVARFGAGRTIRGVNLGGWLLLEKWIVPKAFGTLEANDEWELSSIPEGRARLRDHRDSFIVESDFKWIKERGLDAVRLPVGYWALKDAAPHIAAPYVGAAQWVDSAFSWAKNHGLGVLLDLHGAPGSQNGKDHSGRSGEMTWHTDTNNIKRTLQVLEDMAKRYGNHPNLIGLQLLNEPHVRMPMDIIKRFTVEAYGRVRPHLPAHVSLVLHDAFRPMEWSGFMQEPQYRNVMLDAHWYQCYSDADRKRTLEQHVEKAKGRAKTVMEIEKQLPMIVGEWSNCVRGEGVQGLTPAQMNAGQRAFAMAQLRAYDTTRGWFFWTLKTDNPTRAQWSLREGIERGWMPDNYAIRPFPTDA